MAPSAHFITANTLIVLSAAKIGVEERKQLFDAGFLNDFQSAAAGGTHYGVTAYISPRGIYRVRKPFLVTYVLRRAIEEVTKHVLDPRKAAVETETA